MVYNEAIQHLFNGGKVTRPSWGASFIWLKPGALIKSEYCQDPVLKTIAMGLGGEVRAVPVLCRYNSVERTIQTGWSPTHEETLADDWVYADVEFDGEGLAVRVPIKSQIDKEKEDAFEGAEVIRKPSKEGK